MVGMRVSLGFVSMGFFRVSIGFFKGFLEGSLGFLQGSLRFLLGFLWGFFSRSTRGDNASV